MFFPEALYLLSQRDQQVTWIDPSFSFFTELGAGLERILTVFTVPEGRAFLLQSACITATPQAVENLRNLAITVRRNALFSVHIAVDPTVLADGVRSGLNWSGSILVPPGWQVEVQANFDPGTSAINSVSGFSAGLLIPVGNVQRI